MSQKSVRRIVDSQSVSALGHGSFPFAALCALRARCVFRISCRRVSLSGRFVRYLDANTLRGCRRAPVFHDGVVLQVKELQQVRVAHFVFGRHRVLGLRHLALRQHGGLTFRVRGPLVELRVDLSVQLPHRPAAADGFGFVERPRGCLRPTSAGRIGTRGVERHPRARHAIDRAVAAKWERAPIPQTPFALSLALKLPTLSAILDHLLSGGSDPLVSPDLLNAVELISDAAPFFRGQPDVRLRFSRRCLENLPPQIEAPHRRQI